MNPHIRSLAVSGILAVMTATSPALATGLSLKQVQDLTSRNPVQVKSDTRVAGDLPRGAIAQETEEQTNIRVYERASPAVVSIDTGKGNGSGSIISSDGLVLTNAHVVSEGDSITVILSDGRKLIADIIGFGEDGLDLAVLKIRDQTNLPTIPIAAPGSVKVGQQAYAIGNPFGQFQGTFTKGIVSRIDRERGLIQTDTPINPGNSGGPLLNNAGELIGVNTSIFTRGQGGGNIGIGFAIAADKIPTFLALVREGRAPRVSQRRQSLFDKDPQAVPLNGPVINGQLTDKSNVLPVDDSFFDLYSFEGKAGQQITIDMKSQELDPYLILLGPNQLEMAQDDDGGGEKDARIIVTLPVDGNYTVMANSFEARQSGTYTLELRASATASEAKTILREEGVLADDAPTLPSDGSLYREYTFEGRAGQPVSIMLESTEFDAYVALFGPNGRLVGENDDFTNSSKNAFLSATLPTNGRYRVVVNSYDASGRGRYVLTIR